MFNVSGVHRGDTNVSGVHQGDTNVSGVHQDDTNVSGVIHHAMFTTDHFYHLAEDISEQICEDLNPCVRI